MAAKKSNKLPDPNSLVHQIVQAGPHGEIKCVPVPPGKTPAKTPAKVAKPKSGRKPQR